MKLPRLSDYEIEMRLGYTPCICGVLDGTWHSKCYRGKTQEQVDADSKKAFQIARAYLRTKDALLTYTSIEKAKDGG